MTMDFTRLIDRLDPPADGETPVRHRTGIVDAVNSDGTVDLSMGGVVVPGVSVVGGSAVGIGLSVQVLVWRGDMLVLGAAGFPVVAEVTSGTPTTLALTPPPGYTGAMRVTAKLRTAAAAVQSQITLGLSGIAGTNFYRQLRHTFTTSGLAASAADARANDFDLGNIAAGASATAGEFGGLDALIGPQSGGRIPVQWQAGLIPGTATGDFRTVVGNGRAAASTFTAVVIGNASGLVAGSRIELWPG